MKFREKVIQGFFFCNGLLVVIVLLGIFTLLVLTSIPAFKEVSWRQFLFSSNWNPTSYVKPSYGIVAMLVSTFMVTLGALLIAVPLGIGTAAYLSDVANRRVREIAKPTVEILAGIPSVVIGFLGIVLVGPFIAKIFNLHNGLNALNGSVLLAIMALPTIISLSEDALKSVPDSYREGALALGATKWQAIKTNVLPYSISGMLTGTILGLARAAGETAPILFTGAAFYLPFLPKSPFSQFMALPYHLYIMATQHHAITKVRPIAYATALVLIAVIFLMNLFAVVLRYHLRKHKTQ